jgi:hypothetical protein
MAARLNASRLYSMDILIEFLINTGPLVVLMILFLWLYHPEEKREEKRFYCRHNHCWDRGSCKRCLKDDTSTLLHLRRDGTIEGVRQLATSQEENKKKFLHTP